MDAEAKSGLLLDENNFKSLPSLRDTDMPRVSGMLQNYRASFIMLAYQHVEQGGIEPARALFAATNKFIPEDILPMPEGYKGSIEALEKALNKSK